MVDDSAAAAPAKPSAAAEREGAPSREREAPRALTKPQIFGAIFGIVAGFIMFLIIPVGAPPSLVEAMPNALLPVDYIPKIAGGMAVWLIIYLLFRPIESGHTGLIFLAVMLILGFSSMSVLTYFAINPGWFQISAFVIAAAMMRTGLAKRVAYVLMHTFRANTPAKFMFAITVVTLVVILLVPSSVAEVGVLMPIMLVVAAEWGLPARSESKRGIPILAICAVVIVDVISLAGLWTKTGFSQSLIALQIARMDIEWFQWLRIAGPTIWFTALIFTGCIVMIYRNRAKGIASSPDVLAERVRELGPVTPVEKRVLIMMVIVLILWATGAYTHIAPGWIAMGAVCLLAFPSFGVFKNIGDLAGTIVWPLLFFETALVSLAAILGQTGLTVSIGNMLSGMQPTSEFGFFGLSSLVGTFLTAFVGQNVMQAVIIPLFVEWGGALGIAKAQSFLAVWLPTIFGGNLLPSLIPPVVFAWTFKYKGEPMFTFKDGALLTLVLFAVYYIFGTISQLTWWSAV